MGGNTYSKEEKEEVIIAQSGISGGASTGVVQQLTTREICTIAVLIMAVLVIVWFLWTKCKNSLRKQIRREICRSQEQV